MDADAIAKSLARLIIDTEEARILGHRGREHVREHFLLPEIVRRYLVLLRYYTGADSRIPPFRMNGLSYNEVLGMLKTDSLREGSLPAAKWAV